MLAMFSAFRLTTLFSTDAIWQPVRTRLTMVPWHCSLCMSVWAGIAATIFLLTLPWLNWPLGLSWLYLAYEREKKMSDNKEIEARVNAAQNEMSNYVAQSAKRSAELAAELASAGMRIQALQAEFDEYKKANPPKEEAA